MKKRLFPLALALIMALSLFPTPAFAADQIPVKISNITLSNVITTNEYETAKELLPGGDTVAEYEHLYGLGNVGFWNEADKEYHLGTFWCYLLPEDATISIHLTKETPECYVYMYTLKEGEAMLGSRYWQTTFITGLKYEPNYGKSEADILISKEYVEGGLASMNLDPKFDLLQIVSGDENILVWYGGPSASASLFTDTPAGAWYADSVAWAIKEGITKGTSATTFSPDKECSQVEIITFLWRAAGKPSSKTKAPITVASYYQDAVNWAYGAHIITDNFEPDSPCSRLQSVLYIWMALDWPKATKTVATFTDIPDNESLHNAVNWAVEKGVTKGTGTNTFSPGKRCSRAEIITFLYRAYK